MADSPAPIGPQDHDDADLSETPYTQEPLEVEDDAPRRAASARFVVDSEVGADAALRDAMDPANQSLAEALRLSFRVLQFVIVALVILFLASGFQTVEDGKTGVATVWGKIVPYGGAEALLPGPKFSIYPYPAGEFIIVDENGAVEDKTTFAPASRGLRQEEMMERADVTTPLTPGKDGALLTKDGDLAHLEISARYAIQEPVQFVHQVNYADHDRDASALVKLALQRAAVHVTAELSLQEFTEGTDDLRARLQKSAQEVLDGLKCGIQISQVQVQRAYAPLAIEKAQGDLQAAIVAAGEAVEKARQKANETLNAVAGNYKTLTDLIEQYEAAQERGDQKASDELLVSINSKIEGEEANGDVSRIINFARGYQSQIETTLGNEYRKFASLLPAYRENPQLVIRQQWLETYAKVIKKKDTEIVYVPDLLASMNISLSSSAVIQEMRRTATIARKEREANARDMDPTKPYILRGSDNPNTGPGRQLKPDETTGKLRPTGGPGG